MIRSGHIGLDCPVVVSREKMRDSPLQIFALRLIRDLRQMAAQTLTLTEVKCIRNYWKEVKFSFSEKDLLIGMYSAVSRSSHFA